MSDLSLSLVRSQGDLPLHVELEELEQFDIFTYHFGDVFRLYLRGQFAAHRNVAWINMLWAECPHLGSGYDTRQSLSRPFALSPERI